MTVSNLEKRSLLLKMTEKIKECKNCSNPVQGMYCSHCGQKADEKRFTITNLPVEFLHGFFHVHNGLFYTMKELFIRPGVTLRGFIAGKRISYFNPFTYLVLISLVSGVAYNHSGLIEHAKENMLASGETIRFTHQHFSYRMLLAVPTYAVMCWVLFSSFKYNLAEHLLINTFLISQSIVFLTAWLLVLGWLKPDNFVFQRMYASAVISVMVYQALVFFDLFNSGKTFVRLAKSTLAVFGGLGLSYVLMNLLANFLNRI